MFNRMLKIFFLINFLILACVPVVLCTTPAPIVYVAGDGSGDFNCNAKNADVQLNQALQFVTGNPGYTTVYLKGPFTYSINDTLLIGNNTTLEGDSNTTIRLTNNANWEAFKPMIKENNSGGHDITIRGFTIDGNREGNTNVVSGKNYYNLIHLSNCQNISVYNMYMTNNHGDGLKTDKCSNIKLYDNKIYLLGHDVLYASSCSNVEAYNNKITCRANSGLRVYNTNHVNFHDNIITSEGYGGAGIQIQKYGTPTMDDIEVYNNTINRTVLAGIWIFGSNSYPTSSANVYIHHNQIYDTGNTSSNNIGGILSDGFNALIENNVIDGAYGAGIMQNNVYSVAPAGSGYVITVRNNIITNTRTSKAGGNGSGICNLLTDTHSFFLQNNSFYNNTGGDYIGVEPSHSDIVADPQYADRDKHDYHLKSKAGRWDGSGWVNDNISSPCIDAGDPLSDYSNEPEPNGDRINIGPDGNTRSASKSELDVSTPIANFTANLTVKFTDTSTNSPIGWEWNFGDGNTSTEQNPEHIFSDEGTYNVTLVVTNADGSTNEKSMVITANRVLTPPVADFTANKTEGTTPLTVKFTDTSTNSPTGWEWNFGDGSTSTEQNPEHIFSGEGTYNVTLVATNADGSSNEKSMVITVNRVLTPPVANFVADKTEGTTPLTVKFTDTSTNSPTGWEWNFGDGSTSTEQNPEHIFSGKGTYNVTLVATNADGSSNEKSMVITVNRVLTPPVANFVADKTEGTTPLTVKFTDTSTNSPTGWKWNFGDGSTSTEQNPEHVFSGKGTYNVTLVATNGDGSSNEKSMVITVRVSIPPVANFTAHQTAPLKVQFNDLSLNETLGRTWTFGDGSTSTDANPIHAYATAGAYIVNLTASNADGTDTTRKTITVTGTPALPTASFTAVPQFGRAPLTVKFTDNSVNATSIKWDFGDNSATTTESKPSHIYKNTGLYTVKLTAINGGKSNVATKTIYVAR